MSQPLPAAARRSLLVYNLFFPLVFLALLPGLLLRMVRRGGFRESFGQRFGSYNAATRTRFSTGRWWWIHSISVGETLVALKLSQELHRRDPALHIALTVTTSTGFALARDARVDWLEVLYNPIDARPVVRSCLDVIRPERLILVEGEAWPNLLSESRRRGIPIALVDARLSPRSEKRFLNARYWVTPIFNLIDQVGVTDAADRARWQRLGIRGERLHLTGSIKFDSADDLNPTRTSEFSTLLESMGVNADAPILVAGSTWAPEEKIIAETFLALRSEFPGLFLIIVPRHVERASDILRDLAPLPLRVRQRSTLSPERPEPADALLVDTTGELRDWYAFATVVFVGKSLPGIADIGGQNPAEPAALGKPIVLGPHTENFAALVHHLHSQQAVAIVPDAPALAREIRSLLLDPKRRNAMGQRARIALTAHRGATARTAALFYPA